MSTRLQRPDYRRGGIAPTLRVALLVPLFSFLPAVAARASVAVTLSSATSPTTGQPGATINVTGSGFPTDAISASSVLVTLTPTTSSDAAVTVPASALTTITGSVRRVTFQIPASVVVGSPAAYTISIAGTTLAGVGLSSSNDATLTISPSTSIVAVSPITGKAGQALSVTISGVGTNFVQGSTSATFGAGISVGGAAPGSFGPVTVTTPSTAIANLMIDASATPISQTIAVSTGDPQTSPLQNGFTVSSGGAMAPNLTGITSTVTLDVFNTSESNIVSLAENCGGSSDCFSIQQNFFVVSPDNSSATYEQSGNGLAGDFTYWVQNVVSVYDFRGSYYALPIVNVWLPAGWVSPLPQLYLLAFQRNTLASLVQLPASISLTSSVSNGTLTLTSSANSSLLASHSFSSTGLIPCFFATSAFCDRLGLLTTRSYISSASQLPALTCALTPPCLSAPAPPELVLVGAGAGSETDFKLGTTGNVLSSIVLNGNYAGEVQEAAVGAGATPTQTGETSTGLYWNLPCASSLVWTSDSLASFTSTASPCDFFGRVMVQSEGIWFEPANGTEILADNFTLDSGLNSGLWTSSSPLLSAIASDFSSSFVSPTLNFISSGMEMSGVNGYFQFSGIEMLQPLAPPFTVQANVTGIKAVGNTFVLYLVASNLVNSPNSPYVAISGNLNSANGSFYGVWEDDSTVTPTFGQSLGQPLQPAVPALLNDQYTLNISVDATGMANVWVGDAAGNEVGRATGICLGQLTNGTCVSTGQFNVVLGQREGSPSLPAGPNVANWSYFAATTGSN